MARKNAFGFLQLFGTNVVTKICWALILLLLLRKLGASQFGTLATLWSAATIAAGFVDFGTGQALLREGSRNPTLARQLATQSARIQLVMTVAVAALLAFGTLSILHTTSLTPWNRALVITLGVATPLIDRFQALFTVWSQIGSNYRIYSGTRSVSFVVLLLAIIWTLWHGGGLVAVSLVYFVLTVLFALVMGISTWKLLPPREVASRPPPSRQLLKQGLPFLMIMTLTLAYGRIEVTVLGMLGHSASAGSYHVIYQLVLLVYSVCGLFFTIMYPQLYRHRGDIAAMTSDFRDTSRWLSLLGWMAAAPLWLFAEPILHLMGGTPLATYAPLLRVLAVLVLIIPASAALNFLLPADRLYTRVLCDVVGITITATIAAWAATHNQPIWVATGAVIGYAIAVTMAHTALRNHLSKSTRILLVEFCRIGLRVAPGAAVAFWLAGPWWLRLVVFTVTSAILLLSTCPWLAQRMRVWLVNVDS